MEDIKIRLGYYKPRVSFEIACYHDLQNYALKTGVKWIRIKKSRNSWDVVSLTNPGLIKRVSDDKIIRRFLRWLNWIYRKK